MSKDDKKKLYRRVWSEVWPSSASPLVLGSGAMLASSYANQALPRAIGRLVYSKRDVSLAWIVLGGGVASLLRTTLLNRAEQGVAMKLRLQAVQALLTRHSIEWFQCNNDTTSPAAIGTVLEQDVDKIAQSWTNTLANLFRSTSAVCWSTYHMLMLDPQLLAVSASVVPLVGATAMVFRKALKRSTTRQRNVASQIATFVQERLAHL